MASIPVAVCGKDPLRAAEFSRHLEPEYQTVHHFATLAAFLDEFPAVMQGEIFTPQSTLGSNPSDSSTSPKIPRGLFVGGGFTEEELAQIVPQANHLPIVAPNTDHRELMRKTERAGTQLSLMEAVATWVKEKFRECGLVQGAEEGQVEVGLHRL